MAGVNDETEWRGDVGFVPYAERCKWGVDVINARFFTALRSVLNDGGWENFNISVTQAGLAIHDGEAVNSRKRKISIHDCKSNQFTR